MSDKKEIRYFPIGSTAALALSLDGDYYTAGVDTASGAVRTVAAGILIQPINAKYAKLGEALGQVTCQVSKGTEPNIKKRTIHFHCLTSKVEDFKTYIQGKTIKLGNGAGVDWTVTAAR